MDTLEIIFLCGFLLFFGYVLFKIFKKTKPVEPHFPDGGDGGGYGFPIEDPFPIDPLPPVEDPEDGIQELPKDENV